MSQSILQPFFRFSCVTSSSLNSPGEPPMVEKFKYLRVTVTNTNDIREEINRRINMGSACYYSFEKKKKLSRLLSKKKNGKLIHIIKKQLLPVVFMVIIIVNVIVIVVIIVIRGSGQSCALPHFGWNEIVMRSNPTVLWTPSTSNPQITLPTSAVGYNRSAVFMGAAPKFCSVHESRLEVNGSTGIGAVVWLITKRVLLHYEHGFLLSKKFIDKLLS